MAAFVAPLPLRTHLRARTKCARVRSRPPHAMAEAIRPAAHSLAHDVDDRPPPIPAPEVAAVAGPVCEFMNEEHVRDIANYVVHFGKKFDDLSQLSAVRMTGMDATGFTTDVVSCDETSCVCVQERLDWPLGLCHNAGDIINALKHLSMLCGLPADF